LGADCGDRGRGIAIVVSVIYLGRQIRANTKVLRSQAHDNALSLAQRAFEMAIADQSLADVIETAYVRRKS